MQKIRSVLKIGSSGVTLCDTYGSSSGAGLELMLGTGSQLEFELRSEPAGTSAVLPDYPVAGLAGLTYYFALDFECGNNSAPPLLIIDGISAGQDENGRTLLTVPLVNSAVEQIANALKGRSSIELVCELGGIDGEGKTAFAWQFPVTVRSRVYLGDSSQTPEPATLYYTAVQVNAIVNDLKNRLDHPLAGEIVLSPEAEYFAGENVESVLQIIGKTIDGLQTELEGI